jgi:beta-lactamase superfamily II metal-dependent hydrolase
MAKYEYEILKVGDADVIFIRHYIQTRYEEKPYIILIDAGNVSDWELVKEHLYKYYGTYNIDLAVCTHPDNDHMGGFFSLLDDEDIAISEFWLIDPAEYLTQDDIKYYRSKESAMNAVRQIFNKPQDSSQNLIDKILYKLNCNEMTSAISVIKGTQHKILPLKVVAPTAKYYGEIVKNMVTDYNVNPYEPSDTSKYDEAEALSIETAKSSIDDCEDDTSPYNQSSIVLLYEPEDGKKMLFAGDATRASLIQMIDDYPEIVKIDLLKVPHHGSKHNLSSAIIDVLKPQTSYISAKGSRKHPSNAVVNYLSKYGNVYSTHKCNCFIHRSNGISRANTQSVEPLKKKQ